MIDVPVFWISRRGWRPFLRPVGPTLTTVGIVPSIVLLLIRPLHPDWPSARYPDPSPITFPVRLDRIDGWQIEQCPPPNQRRGSAGCMLSPCVIQSPTFHPPSIHPAIVCAASHCLTTRWRWIHPSLPWFVGSNGFLCLKFLPFLLSFFPHLLVRNIFHTATTAYTTTKGLRYDG